LGGEFGLGLRPSHQFFLGESLAFKFGLESCLPILGQLVRLLLLQLCPQIGPAVGFLAGESFRLNFRLDACPLLSRDPVCLAGGEFLVGLEFGPIFGSEGGVGVEFFLESGPAEGCALVGLVGLDPRPSQNLILVGLVGVGFCLDARPDDSLAGQPAGGEFGFDARTSQGVLGFQDGDVSAWAMAYL
jgi:hypothetical protein